MMPTLKEIATTEKDLLARIERDIASIPEVAVLMKEAKARLQASPYADAVECTECGGSGRYLAGYCVGYDEYDYDEELCTSCLTEGVFPWDTNRSWFDEEAAKASLDPTFDEEEREDALHDLLMDQAYDVDVDPPEVIQDYHRAMQKYLGLLQDISQDLSVLSYHYDLKGSGDQSWVSNQLDRITEILKVEEKYLLS